MKLIKVWITKYALLRGIFEIEGLELGEEYNNTFAVKTPRFPLSCEDYFIRNGDWHRTKESAIKKAEEMRDKKIKSLKSEIEIFNKMKFE